MIEIPNQISFIRHYGRDEQTRLAMEECGELIQAINKIHRKENSETMNGLEEEIADVLIMIEQLKFIYDVSDFKLQKIVDEKYQRQLKRMKSDNFKEACQQACMNADGHD